MTQLAATVDADDELWTLDALPSTPYVQVADEIVEVRSKFPSQTYTLTGEELPPRIRVRRAVGGTTAASHNSGSTLTPTYGLGSGGGGGAIAVTGTVSGEVPAATGLQLQGTVTDEGGGVAGYVPDPPSTILLTGDETSTGNFFRGPDDPADTPAYLAVLEPGDLWVDTFSGTQPYTQKVRNSTNDGWLVGTLAVSDPPAPAEGAWDSGWSIDPDTGEFNINVGWVNITLSVDGTLLIWQSGDLALTKATITFGVDGSVVIGANNGSNSLTLAADGTYEINGAQWLRATAAGFILNLPTADPVSAGVLWNDADVVKVSAG